MALFAQIISPEAENRNIPREIFEDTSLYKFSGVELESGAFIYLLV
jgi:hypothetical protein